MSKSVRPKDLTDKISFGLTKKNISAEYFIVWTDKIFQISLNDWHFQKDFDISVRDGTKNNNSSSHMLLNHCYAFGLLL